MLLGRLQTHARTRAERRQSSLQGAGVSGEAWSGPALWASGGSESRQPGAPGAYDLDTVVGSRDEMSGCGRL